MHTHRALARCVAWLLTRTYYTRCVYHFSINALNEVQWKIEHTQKLMNTQPKKKKNNNEQKSVCIVNAANRFHFSCASVSYTPFSFSYICSWAIRFRRRSSTLITISNSNVLAWISRVHVLNSSQRMGLDSHAIYSKYIFKHMPLASKLWLFMWEFSSSSSVYASHSFG